MLMRVIKRAFGVIEDQVNHNVMAKVDQGERGKGFEPSRGQGRCQPSRARQDVSDQRLPGELETELQSLAARSSERPSIGLTMRIANPDPCTRGLGRRMLGAPARSLIRSECIDESCKQGQIATSATDAPPNRRAASALAMPSL